MVESNRSKSSPNENEGGSKSAMSWMLEEDDCYMFNTHVGFMLWKKIVGEFGEMVRLISDVHNFVSMEDDWTWTQGP